MTSTSVKDVGTVLQAVQTNAGANVKKANESSFQEVFNRQTSQNKPREVVQQKKETKPVEKLPEASGKISRESKAEDITETTETTEAPKDTWEVTEVEEEDLVRAMEVLQTAAGELITKIAETFDISVEEVNLTLEQLDMEPMDVLQQDKLGTLLLEIGNGEDSLALLTNESLYQNFKTVMDAQSNILAECSESLSMDAGQMEELVEQVQKMTVTLAEEVPLDKEPDMPVIEVVKSEEVAPQSTQDEAEVKVVTSEETKAPAQSTETRENKNVNPDKDGSSQGREGNMVLPQTQEQTPVVQNEQTRVESFTSNLETQDIMRQIMDYMKIQIKPDMSNLEMQLHPASLGTLQIQVASKGGVLTAQFVTENEAVKAVLESQMIQLKESFAQQGVRVEAIEVTVQTHQFESNLEQGRGREQEMPEKRTRARRINLNESLMADDMEDLNEEALGAQMMNINGTTVDYTA